MKKDKPRRPSADNTREKILKAAKKCFIQYGFSGTSMSKLAEMAKINQSLISHHFGNKQELWQQVKLDFINNISVDPVHPYPRNLKNFLKEIIEQRFQLYSGYPEVIRFLNWQRLETQQEKLMGNHHVSPYQWLEPIQFLQEKGQLNKELDPEFIMIWIANSVTAAWMDEHTIFKKNSTNIKKYINMLIDGFGKALQ